MLKPLWTSRRSAPVKPSILALSFGVDAYWGDQTRGCAVDKEREPAKDAPDDDEPLGRDDRVSLHPLSFEEAVRTLHSTPRKGTPRKKDAR